MAKRRNRDREILEFYLLNLLLAYRPILRISGVIILAYSVVTLLVSPTMVSITLGVAIILLSLSGSYQATLYLAKVAAWVGTIRRKSD